VVETNLVSKLRFKFNDVWGDSVKVTNYFVFSWSEKLATPVAQRLDRVLRPANSARKVILYLLFALVKQHKQNFFSVCFFSVVFLANSAANPDPGYDALDP
jgi:hypothetical protein